MSSSAASSSVSSVSSAPAESKRSLRVFLTGATGFVGSVVAQELIRHGHKVVGLTRSEAGAKALTELGIEPHIGSLEDVASLVSGAKAADAVINCGFNHDFVNSSFAASAEVEYKAVHAMGAALEGSGKPLLVTGGVLGLPVSDSALGKSTERDALDLKANPRARTMVECHSYTARGVVVMEMRLSPTTHGAGDKAGFIPMMITADRAKGVAAYVGDGANKWPAVHRLDAAVCYRLALEKGVPGVYHMVAEEGVAVRDVAAAIGSGLGVGVKSVAAGDEATSHFGPFMAMVASVNSVASSARTREVLGWTPTHVGLLEDIKHNYFPPAAAAGGKAAAGGGAH